MSGWGWPSHGEDKLSQIKQCYTEGDRKQQCPLCALRAENERLRGELQGVADHLLSMSGGAHNCAGCGFLHKQIARALAAPPEDKEESRG